MRNINKFDGKHLYTAVQGFAAGAIVMAIICGYNRSQMPMAIMCLIMSIIFRLGD